MRESQKSDWTLTILKECPSSELKEHETNLIIEHKSDNPDIGYNIFRGDNAPSNEES